jgi:sarcosine oxidase subunit beta
MADKADVVIIGAGIQGLSAAYHTAKLGVRNIRVIEKEFIGAGSSGRSASMLLLQEDTELKVRLSQFSYERYQRFHEELGVDPGFKNIGYLSVVPENMRDQARLRAEARQKLGVKTVILSPHEITALVPVINVDDIALGVFGPQDGVLDANAIMQGYSAGARKIGVSIDQGRVATGIRTKGDAVVAVETSGGSIETGMVVNAAGADAIEVAGWLGIDLPIDNRRRSIYITDEFPRIPPDTPMVMDAQMEWYCRKEGPGVLMGMGKEESRQASMAVNWDYLPQVVEFAMHRVPILSDAKIIRGWTGIRPLTQDRHPILGPVVQVRGFINDCGWGGEGVMHAPAGGQIVAECIADTQDRTFSLDPFRLKRFTATAG